MHLSRELLDPKVSVDVSAYNSKVYYIIADGAGNGEQVYRIPIFGSETVLDAIGQINGLPVVANKRKIWIARPLPSGSGQCRVFPVDWKAITRGGVTETNYQLFPGDRLFVMAECLITADTYLARIISPFERILGISLLTSTTIQSFQSLGGGGGGGNNTGVIVGGF